MVEQNREVDGSNESEVNSDWDEGAKMVSAIFKTCLGTWKEVSKRRNAKVESHLNDLP